MITFYHIGSDGKPDYPVLYIDTAKTSTIEQTAEQADARGGKGNPKLISWDYGKEITVTLEDALFSAKSLAIMFGDGTLKTMAEDETTGYVTSKPALMKTEQFMATATTLPTEATSISAATVVSGWNQLFVGPNGQRAIKKNPKFYDAAGTPVDVLVVGSPFFCSYDLDVDGQVVEISGNSFPGTYYVTGDTYARSATTGEDEFFQFIVPKAKVQSENTITLEAEGDPSVFNMSLTVLRPDDGVMMRLVKYNLDGASSVETEEVETVIVHNHYLAEAETE